MRFRMGIESEGSFMSARSFQPPPHMRMIAKVSPAVADVNGEAVEEAFEHAVHLAPEGHERIDVVVTLGSLGLVVPPGKGRRHVSC